MGLELYLYKKPNPGIFSQWALKFLLNFANPDVPFLGHCWPKVRKKFVTIQPPSRMSSRRVGILFRTSTVLEMKKACPAAGQGFYGMTASFCT
jgi:hypothetical protein